MTGNLIGLLGSSLVTRKVTISGKVFLLSNSFRVEIKIKKSYLNRVDKKNCLNVFWKDDKSNLKDNKILLNFSSKK